MKVYFIYFIFFLLCFPIISFAQIDKIDLDPPDPQLSFYANYGVPFFEKCQDPTFSSFDSSFDLDAGTHIIIGFNYRHYFDNKLSMDFAAAYQFGKFSRTEFFNFTSFIGEFREGVFKNDFETRSILYPIKLNYHFKKWNISTGAVLAWHLATSVEVEQNYFVDGALAQSKFNTYKDGDFSSTPPPFVDTQDIDLENRINIQFLVGMDYQIHKRVRLELEVRQNLLKNRLQKISTQYDVVGNQYEYFHPYPRIISFGVHYNFIGSR